jgi:hypothetical protein
VSCLYAGATAAALASALGHYPWFATFNFLSRWLAAVDPASGPWAQLVRSAQVGLAASVVSDLFTNWLRVVKTFKQVSSSLPSSGKPSFNEFRPTATAGYAEILARLVREEGVLRFACRGMGTRVVANGLQSAVFAVCWRHFQDSAAAMSAAAV